MSADSKHVWSIWNDNEKNAMIERHVFHRPVGKHDWLGDDYWWIGHDLPGAPTMLHDGLEAHPVGNYITDWGMCRRMEDRVFDTGRGMLYGRALFGLMSTPGIHFLDESLFLVLSAKPWWRCLAALIAYDVFEKPELYRLP